MTHGSLFNGIGGFQLAAKWMGWENVFSVEKDEFCNKITKKHFPKCIQYGEIEKVCFKKWRGAIDIITGGDPCQPSSRASAKRSGKEDGRYLWPQYHRVVEEILPKRIVNENVPGTIENGILDQKIIDLEAIGYTCWTPFIMPASACGADYKRDRVWLIAHLNTFGMEGSTKKQVLRKPDLPGGEISEPFQEAERRFNTFESRLCRTIHGIPNGVDRIKSLGNSIVPQVAFQIFKAIEEYENQND